MTTRSGVLVEPHDDAMAWFAEARALIHSGTHAETGEAGRATAAWHVALAEIDHPEAERVRVRLNPHVVFEV